METGNNGDAGVITVTTGSDSGERRWNIKVSYIECDNPNK